MISIERSWLLLLLGLGLGLTGGVWGGPQIQSWQTSQGAKVMYVHAPELPMVDVRVVFDAGSARDGKLPGLATFTNALLNEGAGSWDADTIAQRLEERGIQYGNGALRDMGWTTLRTLTEPDTLKVAVETLAAILAKPTFDSTAIERIRQQMQAGLRQTLQSPSGVAQRRFFATLYAGHPYGSPSEGNEISLAAIARGDLQAFHRQYYVASNAVIAIVGAVDRAQAERIAATVVGQLPRGRHAAALPAPPSIQPGELRQDFPSSQTHIYVGQPGMARHDPDYFALYVGNHVFGGGGLVSLLGEEVRNKRGLSYSVYSYFSPMRAPGPFLMVAQTKNSQADDALDVMRRTLRGFVENGPDPVLLDEAKRNITGGFPLQIAGNKKIVEYIAMMGFYDYPLDWLDTLVGKVDAVSVAQVKDAFARRVDPERAIVVVVGGGERAAGR